MLRIDRWSEGPVTVLKAEGKLAGPWVEELGNELGSLPEMRQVIFELRSLDHADEAGLELLRGALAAGARVRSVSGFVACLLQRACDADRVRAILLGNEEAFLDLASRCHPVVSWVARCLVPERAEEVARRAWRVVLAQLALREDGLPLDEWVMRTAAEAILAEASPGRPAGPGDGADSGPASDLPIGCARAALPRGWMGTRAAGPAIRAAIESLPPLTRAVLVLRDVAGLSTDAVGKALRMEHASQRVALHRARTSVLTRLAAGVSAAA